MRKLTENQILFLLDIFFANPNLPAWASIGRELLTKGKCIVAGTDQLWLAGIGNFINTENAPDAIGCSLLTFDLESFLQTNFYKSIETEYLANLLEEVNAITHKYNDLKSLSDK